MSIAKAPIMSWLIVSSSANTAIEVKNTELCNLDQYDCMKHENLSVWFFVALLKLIIETINAQIEEPFVKLL